MVAFGWCVLALVFVDELAAMAAYAVWGWQAPDQQWLSLVLAWVLPVLAMLAWFFLASPKARYGGPVIRPVTKILVFGIGTLLLWAVGQHRWALAFLVLSMVVNGLAMIPVIRDLAAEPGA